VCFLHTEHLLAKGQDVAAIRIERRRGIRVAVVDRVDRAHGAVARKPVIDPSGPEVLANGLQRTARHLGHAVAVRIHRIIGRTRRRDRPEIQQAHALHDRRGILSRLSIRHKSHRGLMQILGEPLVVAEHEGFVASERSAQRDPELVAGERRRRVADVEIVGRIHGAVPEELECGPVPLVGARLRHDAHLAARLLAVLGAVGVAKDIELPDRIDAEQLAAGAARRHIVLGRTGVLDPVQEEQVLLRPVAGHGKHVGGGRVGDANAAGLFPGEIHDTRVQQDEQVVAAAVQRQVFHLLLFDES
jgi:hypothetical protein